MVRVRSSPPKGREQRQQGPWGPGSLTYLVWGHCHKTNKEFIANSFSLALKWVGMGVIERLWHQGGWLTKTVSQENKLQSLCPEKMRDAWREGLREVIAKAIQGRWLLPNQDSALSVSRVTYPLPWPWRWWPLGLKTSALWSLIIWLGWGLDTGNKLETCYIWKISCIERICIQIYNIHMPQSYQVILSSIPYSKQWEKNKRAASDI